IADVFKITKALDRTRPIIDVSGYFHTDETDIVDMHFYEQDAVLFGDFFREPKLSEKPESLTAAEYDWKKLYKKGTPLFISEYGGIGFGNTEDSWGYGNYPETQEEFIERYKGLTEALLFNENIMGFCYTQLYDVEQETNGLMTYQRVFKFPPDIIREINTQTAAVEK
ncbi:MAG: beta-galactosidase, partial [Clostridia bacterium]|nr:beta-galactosidase [Clostridia bacterium]